LLLSFTRLKVLAFNFHRTQSPRLYLSQDSKSSPLSFIGLKVLAFSFIGLKVPAFIFHGTQSPLSLCFHRTQSPLLFTFQRLQYLHLHFKDFNVFCLLHLQDFNVFCLLHFIRLQRLLSFIGLNVLVFVLLRTHRPQFVCFEKKRTSNVFHSIGLQCPPFYVS